MSPITAGPSLIDVLLPQNRPDPYPVYEALRAVGPVCRDAAWGSWMVTGHAEVSEALRDPRFSARRLGLDLSWLPESQREAVAPVLQAITRQVLFLDPPDHTRLRALTTRAFTPRVVERMRENIQAIVDDLLDRVQDTGQIEVIADLAAPFPAVVIAELLGVPQEDRDRFRRWSDDFVVFLDGTGLDAEAMGRVMISLGEFLAYFQALVRRRRNSPRDDLLQALIEAEERGDTLSEEELLTNCMLLLAAGHETTTNLIGNGLLALLRHPEQLEALRDDPALVPSAVNELLRYDPPVQLTARRAMEDVALGGQLIHAGEPVNVILAAANPDPSQFADPGQLDIRRRENRHLSFGHGIHFCPGAALARLEGQIALTTVLRRLPNLALATDGLRWSESVTFRALEALPLRFDA